MTTKEVVLYELYVAKGMPIDDLLEAVCNALDSVKGNSVRIEIHGEVDD